MICNNQVLPFLTEDLSSIALVKGFISPNSLFYALLNSGRKYVMENPVLCYETFL